MVSGTLTLGPDVYDIITAFLNRSGDVWSTAADANIHDTIQTQNRITSSISGGVTYSGIVRSPSGAARSLLGSVATSVNVSVIAAMKRAAAGTAATGSGSVTITGAATASNNTTGTGSITVTGTATARGAATAAGTVTITGSAVAQTPITAALASTHPLYVAHRGGYSATYGEETLPNYTASANQNGKAFLEISVWDTADADACRGSHDRDHGPGVPSGGSLDVPVEHMGHAEAARQRSSAAT